jgi:hypothetical protein
MSRWLFRFSPRAYRIAGAVIVAAGVPSALLQWPSLGAELAIGIFAVHLYLGLTVAFTLPWIQRRARARQSSGSE